jgi:hypothetical protein
MKAEAKKRQIEQMRTGNVPDINQFIEDNTRQVKWLFNNSNKCLKVVEEKKVRKIVADLQSQLKAEREELLTEFVKFADKVYWAENEYTEYKDIIPLFLTSNPK